MKIWMLILFTFSVAIMSNALQADDTGASRSPQEKDLFIAKTQRKLIDQRKEEIEKLQNIKAELGQRVTQLESLLAKKNRLIELKNEQINALKTQEKDESLKASGEQKPVGITKDIMSVTLNVDGKEIEVRRNPNNNNTVSPFFAKTSRPCPPFCIQAMDMKNGVETIGEVDVVQYLQKMGKGDKSIMLVDSRTPDWLARGTIPGAINVSWTHLVPAKGATTESIVKILTEKFGVKIAKDLDIDDVDEAIVEGKAKSAFDFSNAKTLVMFCNGMWCGQSPASIRTLVKYGYPVDKIKYFRGGMQTWELLGFTTIKK